MSFETDVESGGIGRVLRVDLSFDKFATIAYRLGSSAGMLDGANQYSSRIVSLGGINRGFGESRVAAGGTTSMVLDNADGVLDALAARENMGNHSKLRVRIYVCLFVPSPSAPTAFTSKLLGEFSLISWPRRNNASITLDLGDDVLGSVSQLSPLPSIYDWFQVGTSANNPIKGGFGLPDVLDSDNGPWPERGAAQIQLAFGEDWVLALPHILPSNIEAAIDAAYQNKVIVPVCCTTDVADGASYEIEQLRINFIDTGGFGDPYSAPGTMSPPRYLDVPRTFGTDSSGNPFVIWKSERSPVITKAGKSFRIIYLVVDAGLGLGTGYGSADDWLYGAHVAVSGDRPGYETFKNEFAAGYPTDDVLRMRGYTGTGHREYAIGAAGVTAWWVKGHPLSARTLPHRIQHPCDVLRDLVLYYSNATSPSFDSVSHGRVKMSSSFAACAGVVQPWTERANRDTVAGTYQAPPSLRQVMTKLCQSSDIDVFINWSGQFAFSSDLRDYTTATFSSTLLDVPETQVSDVEEWLPSDGERYSVFNRLYLSGGRPMPPEERDVPFQGPYDFEGQGPLGLSLQDRVIEATLEQGWRAWRLQASNPTNNRQLDIVARTKIRFRIGLRGLLLDLGSYFRFTWTRDLAGPYQKAAFKVESISYAAGDDQVEIEAIWQQDVITERVYLLDDEAFRIRSKNVGGTTAKAYPSAASDTCTFDAGLDLFAMGVQPGDILVLLDASEPLNEFAANLGFLINNVGSATQLSVAGAGFNDPMPSPQIEPTEWQIYRGATTDPTSVSDPVLYPDGASMYGKVTNSAGNYSNATQGNRLITG